MSDACHHFWNATKHHKTLTFCSLLTRRTIPRACHAKRHLNVQKSCGLFQLLTWKCASRHNVVHFSTSHLPKVLRHWCALYILTSKCASRHNGVQWRALFRHLNFQKCSENGVFCTFWLRKLLRATTACNLSSLIWPDGSAPAALPSLLFDPPEPQSIGKTVFRDFSTFSRARIFFLLTLSLLWSSSFFSSLLWLFPPLLFHLSILSEAWLLNFLRSGIFHWCFNKQNDAIKEGYGVEIVFQLNWVTDAISVGNFAVIFLGMELWTLWTTLDCVVCLKVVSNMNILNNMIDTWLTLLDYVGFMDRTCLTWKDINPHATMAEWTFMKWADIEIDNKWYSNFTMVKCLFPVHRSLPKTSACSNCDRKICCFSGAKTRPYVLVLPCNMWLKQEYTTWASFYIPNRGMKLGTREKNSLHLSGRKLPSCSGYISTTWLKISRLMTQGKSWAQHFKLPKNHKETRLFQKTVGHSWS